MSSSLRTRRSWVARFVATPVLVVGVLLTSGAPSALAHGGTHNHAAPATSQAATVNQAAMAQITSLSPAADLRVALNTLLAEHVYLAARATGAALAGQTAAFEAAAESLDNNSIELSQAIGAAYGPEAEAAFLPLWRSHIGMFVAYTQGLATDDQAKQDQAVADLLQYSQDFSAFLAGANENLPQPVVAELLQGHILSLKEIPDAQRVRDQDRVYRALRAAIGHMQMLADPLAQATAVKYPDRFPGQAMTPAVDYRVAVNNLLAEHVFLASSAVIAGLAGNEAQFRAAANELDGNSVDLSRGIGAAYGPEAEAAFLPIWRSHIGMFVDYTVGLATKDEPKQQQAVGDLLQYTDDFAAFLNAANENLPQNVVAELLKMHILTLKDVADTQAAGTPAAHFAAVRLATHHMSALGDPLAEATVAKFPDTFAPAAAAPAMTAEIRQFAYRPSPTSVAVGATVTWTNQDGAPHSITDRGGAFDSGLLGVNESYAFTFAQPGEYVYYCTRHPSMEGMVTVD